MFITVNEHWFSSIQIFVSWIRSAADSIQMSVDQLVQPGISDRESILVQMSPIVLFHWRISFELAKSAATIRHAVQLLQDGTSEASDLDRIVDELSLRQRKLFESLLATILLAQYPNRLHFAHFNWKHQEKELNRQIQDLQRFYGAKSLGLAKQLVGIKTALSNVENEPNFKIVDCLYLGAGRQIKSAEQMMIDALVFATDFEKAALKFSYQALYGSTSKNVHFSEGSHRLPIPEEQQIAVSAEQLLSISLCLILRFNDMARSFGSGLADPKGAAREIDKLFRAHRPHPTAAAIAGSASVGDFVVIWQRPSRIGEIVSVNLSNLTQYVSYEVNVLYGQHFGVAEVIPSTEISVLVQNGKKDAFVRNAVSDGIVDAASIAPMRINEQIMTILRQPRAGEAFFAALKENNLNASLFAGVDAL